MHLCKTCCGTISRNMNTIQLNKENNLYNNIHKLTLKMLSLRAVYTEVS